MTVSSIRTKLNVSSVDFNGIGNEDLFHITFNAKLDAEELHFFRRKKK